MSRCIPSLETMPECNWLRAVISTSFANCPGINLYSFQWFSKSGMKFDILNGFIVIFNLKVDIYGQRRNYWKLITFSDSSATNRDFKEETI
jgi:hypothetical protein